MAEAVEDRTGIERARLLATLGGSLVHEVANRIGALTALVEAFGPSLPANEQRELESVAASTRASLSLLRRVVQLLDRGARSVAPTSLVTAVREAAALLARHAQRQSGATIAVHADGDPIVRADSGELLQVLATALLFVQRHGHGGPIDVIVHGATTVRPRASVRMVTTGDATAYGALATALAGDVQSCVPGLLAAVGGTDAMVFAVAMLRRWGGDLRAEAGLRRECALAIELPELR